MASIARIVIFLLVCITTTRILAADPLPDYRAVPRPEDGRHMALAVTKLERGLDPPRPFLIWALGSSYTNKLGNGDSLIRMIRQRFGDETEIAYKKMVGNSCPWQYLRGWARHLVLPDQPDLVLIYTIGKSPDLEQLIRELQEHTTADIIVPTIHWRERGKPFWDNSEDAPDQKVSEVREICQRLGVELVENRLEWADYLRQNELKIESLLSDAVHQSDFGANIVNQNIARHLHRPPQFAYAPETRERRIYVDDPRLDKATGAAWQAVTGYFQGHPSLNTTAAGAALKFEFTGNRIDLIVSGRGSLRVLIDGRPGDQADVFWMTYIQPARSNFSEPRSPARDQSPHGVRLGQNVVPQTWTIQMLDDKGHFELSGSLTGPDGRGVATMPFESNSGQIRILPDEWRRAERNRAGDAFNWEVSRAAVADLALETNPGEVVRRTLAANLTNGRHTLKLITDGDGTITVHALDVYQPPGGRGD